MTEPAQNTPPTSTKQAILHICKREMLRPIRDQILRLAGYTVDSTCDVNEAMTMFHAGSYDLVLIDVEGEHAISEAEQLCSTAKTVNPAQTVAFVCNWRVAVLTDCPDDILRTEFNPTAFVAGVHEIMAKR